jgi:hypothetical protein
MGCSRCQQIFTRDQYTTEVLQAQGITVTDTPATIAETAQAIQRTLADPQYFIRCQENSLERMGQAGGSAMVARVFGEHTQNLLNA